MGNTNVLRIQTDPGAYPPNLHKITRNINTKNILGLTVVGRKQRCEILISPRNVWHSITHQIYLLIQFNKEHLSSLIADVSDNDLPKITSSDDIICFCREKFDKVYKDETFKQWLLNMPLSDKKSDDDDIKKMMFLGELPNLLITDERIEGILPAINLSGDVSDWMLIKEKMPVITCFFGHLPFRIEKWQSDLILLLNEFIRSKTNNIDIDFWPRLIYPTNTGFLSFLQGHLTVLQRFMIERSGPEKTLIERDSRVFLDDIHDEYTISLFKTDNNETFKLFAGTGGLLVFKNNLLYLDLEWRLTGM